MQSQVYERLARMTNLEALWLGDRRYCDLSGGDLSEVRWMTEQWPSLQSICGIDSGGGRGTAEWLQENCPQILVATGLLP